MTYIQGGFLLNAEPRLGGDDVGPIQGRRSRPCLAARLARDVLEPTWKAEPFLLCAWLRHSRASA